MPAHPQFKEDFMQQYLIVIDMQKDFVTGALGSAQARAIVPALAAHLSQAVQSGAQVMFTYDTHHENYMTTHESRFLPVAHCIEGSDGWTLIPELEALRTADMPVFHKPTFGSTALVDRFAALARSAGTPDGAGMQIELCGVCTDICVISNALLLRAALPECDITVNHALCAGVTPQAHEAALTVMRSCQISVI